MRYNRLGQSGLVVSELCLANANQRRGVIVVLAERDKREMEEELAARIDTFHGTRVVCRTGNPANLHDLQIANVAQARSIVALGAGDAVGDASVVKAVLAVLHVVESADVTIVAEVDEVLLVLDTGLEDTVAALTGAIACPKTTFTGSVDWRKNPPTASATMKGIPSRSGAAKRNGDEATSDHTIPLRAP